MVSVLLASAPSALKLPTESEKVALLTCTLVVIVSPAVNDDAVMLGVNVAVYVVPLPLQLLKVPFVVVTSSESKSVDASLSVKVTVAVPELLMVSSVIATATVGNSVS